MKRLTLWLMTGLTGWLALKSLRAEGEAAVAATGDTKRFQRVEGGQERGRAAGRPAEIPPRGWKDILVRTYRSISEDRVLALAAGVTYYVLLALFPGIAALVSIYGMIADPATIGELVAALSGTIPDSAITLVRAQLHHLAAQDEKALGLAFVGGLLASLWSANA